MFPAVLVILRRDGRTVIQTVPIAELSLQPVLTEDVAIARERVKDSAVCALLAVDEAAASITATCHACERNFEFVQLYEPATSWQADKCPHCDARLGIANIGHLALAADKALIRLATLLELMASASPCFTVKRANLVTRIEEAADAFARSSSEEHERPSHPPVCPISKAHRVA